MRSRIFRALIGLLIAAATGTASPAPANDGNASDRTAPGLIATYRDTRHQVVLPVASPNFFLAPRESLHPSIAPELDAEWKGTLSILQADEYTIDAPGAELFVAGRPANGKPVKLAVGATPIRITYHRPAGAAGLQVSWRSSQFPPEPIPGNLFSHAESEATPDLVVEQGRRLVGELGCVGCHATTSPALHKREGPRLGGIGARTNIRWLGRWLENPAAFRPGAVMPVLLEPQERADVAAYLASLGGKIPGRPAPTERTAQLGRAVYRSVGCAACHGGKALALEGLGSKYSYESLAAYLEDPGRVHPGGRMPAMLTGPDEAAEVAAALIASRNPLFEQPEAPGGNPRRGKTLVTARGCLGCHTLEDGRPLASTLRAPALDRLAPDRGCLADAPKGVPLFRLAPADRAALRAFVASFKQHPDVAPAPIHALAQRVAELRCTACHVLDHLRPAAPLAEAIPQLTGVGAKLRTDWIERVLLGRTRVREWLHVRMPHFASSLSKPLAVQFAKAAGVAPGDGAAAPAALAAPARQERGRGLLGTSSKQGGMGCIGCHGWGELRALAESGPQLMSTGDRLRYEWYLRWMNDPVRIASGTSMPNFFRELPAAQADELVGSLWAALSAGSKLAPPDGYITRRARLGGEEMPLPTRDAIVIRWDMPEATPAAIAVGLPGKLSYCFDAGESRLRYAWQGGYVDMSPTLIAKAGPDNVTPTAQIIGEIFYRSDSFPLRVRSADRLPEVRFRGYDIVAGFPRFHYQVDGIDVLERITVSSAPIGIKREFEIARVDVPMWLYDARFAGDRLEIPRGAPVRFDVVVPLERGAR